MKTMNKNNDDQTNRMMDEEYGKDVGGCCLIAIVFGLIVSASVVLVIASKIR